MGDVGVPRLSAERLKEIRKELKEGVYYGLANDTIRELLAELVVVRERAERLEQALRWIAEHGSSIDSMRTRARAVLVEQEKPGGAA